MVGVAQDERASHFLKNRSLYFVLFSLADSRLRAENPRENYHDFANMYRGEEDHLGPFASLELQRKLAADSEALCLEYLSEMRE